MGQPSQELRDAIQSLHAAIVAEQDPKHIQVLSQCLQQMTRVQAEIMQGDQAGPGDQPDPRQAMMAQLGAQ